MLFQGKDYQLQSESIVEVSSALRHATLRGTEISLEFQDGEVSSRFQMPKELSEFLLEFLSGLAADSHVFVKRGQDELTTEQAAQILNVSRPYLVKQLEAGEIPFRMVGNRKRIRADDLSAYERAEYARREVLLEKLTREAQELGMGYDLD